MGLDDDLIDHLTDFHRWGLRADGNCGGKKKYEKGDALWHGSTPNVRRTLVCRTSGYGP